MDQPRERDGDGAAAAIDRTVKLYIGGKQARPDSGYSMEVRAADGRLLGEAPLGNRKDIRNAVEAARKAEGWAKTTAHNRAQVLYYIAENLSQRADEIAGRLADGVGAQQAETEVKALSIGNLKQVFTNEGRAIDWFSTEQGEGRWFLHHATQVKNIWVPYGE